MPPNQYSDEWHEYKQLLFYQLDELKKQGEDISTKIDEKLAEHEKKDDKRFEDFDDKLDSINIAMAKKEGFAKGKAAGFGLIGGTISAIISYFMSK